MSEITLSYSKSYCKLYKRFEKNLFSQNFASCFYKELTVLLFYFSVLNQFSPPGLNLLKHVFGVLYLISLHSNQNDMDAGNLAICTGPSLLWPEDPTQHEVAACIVQSVVQHLIANCIVLFGEEIYQLFGAAITHGRQDSSTGTDSDSMHSLLSIPETTTGLGKPCSYLFRNFEVCVHGSKCFSLSRL